MSAAHVWNKTAYPRVKQCDLLHSLLDTLECRFTSHEPADNSLVSLLNSLASHLETHFEWDECGINLAGLDDRAPLLVGNIEQLKSEQREILHEVGILIGLAKLANSEKKAPSTLAGRFADLRNLFATHEKAVKEILQQAFRANPE
jgi:hypothetical protein